MPGSLIQHLTFFKNGLRYPGKKFNLVCAEDDCSLKFKAFAGFRKHQKTFHEKSVEATSSVEAISSNCDSISNITFGCKDRTYLKLVVAAVVVVVVVVMLTQTFQINKNLGRCLLKCALL